MHRLIHHLTLCLTLGVVIPLDLSVQRPHNLPLSHMRSLLHRHVHVHYETYTFSKRSIHTPIKFFLVTARKRSLGKVIFLHVSVILFRGHMTRRYLLGGSLSRGSLSRQSLSRETCPPSTVSCRWYASYWNAFLFSMRTALLV